MYQGWSKRIVNRTMNRALKKYIFSFLAVITMAAPEIACAQVGPKQLGNLRNQFGALRYVVLVDQGRGGSAIEQFHVPLEYLPANLPEGCLRQINRQRARRGQSAIFSERALSSESPERFLVGSPETRAFTEGEELFPPGMCRRMRLRITRRKATFNSFIHPQGPHRLEQTFCRRNAPDSADCHPFERGKLHLRLSPPQSDMLSGESMAQDFQLERKRVNGLRATRALLSASVSGPTGSAQARLANTSTCGLACRNRPQCIRQIARLGEDGLRELCQLSPPPDVGQECSAEKIPKGYTSPAQCSIYAAFLDQQIAEYHENEMLKPFADLLESVFQPQNCCFQVSSCDDFFQPAAACGSDDTECQLARVLLGLSFAQSLPLCEGVQPPVF